MFHITSRRQLSNHIFLLIGDSAGMHEASLHSYNITSPNFRVTTETFFPSKTQALNVHFMQLMGQLSVGYIAAKFNVAFLQNFVFYISSLPAMKYDILLPQWTILAIGKTQLMSSRDVVDHSHLEHCHLKVLTVWSNSQSSSCGINEKNLNKLEVDQPQATCIRKRKRPPHTSLQIYSPSCLVPSCFFSVTN